LVFHSSTIAMMHDPINIRWQSVFTVRFASWTSESWVQSRYIPVEICGRQSGSGRGFFSTSTSVVLSTSCCLWRILFSILIPPLT